MYAISFISQQPEHPLATAQGLTRMQWRLFPATSAAGAGSSAQVCPLLYVRKVLMWLSTSLLARYIPFMPSTCGGKTFEWAALLSWYSRHAWVWFRLSNLVVTWEKNSPHSFVFWVVFHVSSLLLMQVKSWLWPIVSKNSKCSLFSLHSPRLNHYLVFKLNFKSFHVF